MKIIRSIKKIRSIVKYGGYNEINVSKINYPDILKGKSVLVTGGSSGIGYQIAKKCGECGAKVIITGRNIEKLKKAANEIKYCEYIQWDIKEIDVLEEKLDEVNRLTEGQLDCLINNAGIQPREFFPNVSEEEWQSIYETNSKGAFFLTQELCKRWLIKRLSGAYRKIVFIDSQGGFVGATYPYRMVKWDIRGLTQGLGAKLAPNNILVNAIAPGIVKTEMQQFSLDQGHNTFCDQNLLNRVSLPEEVAELAVFILSDACNFMVGQTIVIDGGYSIK